MKQNSLSIAIAILNWNGSTWLRKFLPSVVQHSQGAQIYLIDNASTDDSVDFVSKTFPMVNIIRNRENKGFAEGYNEGLQKIEEDLYCLLNSDVEVTENWLTPILSLFEERQDLAAVQPKILSFSEKDAFEFAGAGGGLIDNLGYPYCRGRVFDHLEKDHGQYNDTTEIFWASGCALFIRKEDFRRMKGFDERFFAHQEEIDLCWRLKNTGRKIFYCGSSAVYHVGGGTLNKQSAQKTYLNIRNNLSMLLKNLPLPTLLWLIPLRLVLDGLAGLYFGYKNGFPHLWAVVRAHFAFYAQAPGTWKRRSSPQLKKYYTARYIVFKHFL